MCCEAVVGEASLSRGDATRDLQYGREFVWQVLLGEGL